MKIITHYSTRTAGCVVNIIANNKTGCQYHCCISVSVSLLTTECMGAGVCHLMCICGLTEASQAGAGAGVQLYTGPQAAVQGIN